MENTERYSCAYGFQHVFQTTSEGEVPPEIPRNLEHDIYNLENEPITDFEDPDVSGFISGIVIPEGTDDSGLIRSTNNLVDSPGQEELAQYDSESDGDMFEDFQLFPEDFDCEENRDPIVDMSCP